MDCSVHIFRIFLSEASFLGRALFFSLSSLLAKLFCILRIVLSASSVWIVLSTLLIWIFCLKVLELCHDTRSRCFISRRSFSQPYFALLGLAASFRDAWSRYFPFRDTRSCFFSCDARSLLAFFTRSLVSLFLSQSRLAALSCCISSLLLLTIAERFFILFISAFRH